MWIAVKVEWVYRLSTWQNRDTRCQKHVKRKYQSVAELTMPSAKSSLHIPLQNLVFSCSMLCYNLFVWGENLSIRHLSSMETSIQKHSATPKQDRESGLLMLSSRVFILKVAFHLGIHHHLVEICPNSIMHHTWGFTPCLNLHWPLARGIVLRRGTDRPISFVKVTAYVMLL